MEWNHHILKKEHFPLKSAAGPGGAVFWE